jgi:uracil-DNA glycosylase
VRPREPADLGLLDDGLRLYGTYLSAVNRCARLGTDRPAGRDRCLPFLEEEIVALEALRAIVALGVRVGRCAEGAGLARERR